VPHLTVPQLLAWQGLLEVQSRVLRLLDVDLQRRMDLTINEFDLLYQLWIVPGRRLRMNHLAKAVLVTPSGVTRMVSRLEERGLVERINQPHRQAVEAALTGEGEQRLAEAMDIVFGDVKRRFVDIIAPSDITRLVALWRRLRRSLPESAEA
jgi:DNA-binding MarR family transcriptional regulator